jgi:hypothetical protein
MIERFIQNALAEGYVWNSGLYLKPLTTTIPPNISLLAGHIVAIVAFIPLFTLGKVVPNYPPIAETNVPLFATATLGHIK